MNDSERYAELDLASIIMSTIAEVRLARGKMSKLTSEEASLALASIGIIAGHLRIEVTDEVERSIALLGKELLRKLSEHMEDKVAAAKAAAATPPAEEKPE